MSVARSVLAGAATGGRTFTGLAALAVTTPRGAREQPDATLAEPAVRAAVSLAALGELAADKLPQAPSRLSPAGLPGRVLAAGACGAIVARRAGAAGPQPAEAAQGREGGGAALAPGRPGVPAAQVAVCAGAAAAASIGAAWLGVRWRGWAAARLNASLAALLEDAVVVGLAAATVSRARPAARG
ncbi:hypothetical protein SAMN05443575_3052 [Jatrophihabitans endophyticus]|uniref:DUF4126 domain-containing protein n=1 Tax=Jatrophihabitans endophyticus TaxID=1206085 RepID=A0A1M5PDJ7_9ACTN|nr:hypothetical protein [Jatrophihabitans endophyticus]SHG99841.1 hypothetical protein SAMN05443575_3052 [Jatrophihabitans endophyticus]